MAGVDEGSGEGVATPYLCSHPTPCVCSHLHPVRLFRAQLSSVTSGLDERTRELADLTVYYDSMLQARIVDLDLGI